MSARPLSEVTTIGIVDGTPPSRCGHALEVTRGWKGDGGDWCGSARRDRRRRWLGGRRGAVVPGALLIWAAILAWGIYIGTTTGWAVVAVATALVVCGQVVKYTIPGKRLRAGGVHNRSLVIGGLLAIVGFFVIPFVGLIIGFVMGVYASELRRVGPRSAWPSTTAALRAAGTSTLIELMSALLATGVWIIGVIAT